jgi:SAM-dependent methyltransferase
VSDSWLRELFAYERWPSREPTEWGPGAERGTSPGDNLDFHVDLGCGTRPKGRIGVDRYAAAGVAVVCDLETLVTFTLAAAPGKDAHEPGVLRSPAAGVGQGKLPFADSSIKSVISHHVFEHIGAGFVALIDDLYRVLEPGGVLRAITPLFPSWSAVCDPDHKRWFVADPQTRATSWDAFCPGERDHDEFSVPYTRARFEKVDVDLTAPGSVRWTEADRRELRVTLRAVKP